MAQIANKLVTYAFSQSFNTQTGARSKYIP